jgi:FkbM family methyltransferase
MRDLLKRWARAAGYRLERWRPANRFGAMSDALELLRLRDFQPRVIIDGGANVGEWTEMALRIFPGAAVHLVEPQPACRPRLEKLARTREGLTVHAVALSQPGRTRLAFTGGVAEGGTGVHVLTAAESNVELECPSTTLDELFVARISRADRPLLKLDLEGHELDALRGADAVLAAVEVIVIEARLYDINHNGLPVFRDVFQFLADRGFELYDVASTGWRRRDMRMHMLDAVFVRTGSALAADQSWL